MQQVPAANHLLAYTAQHKLSMALTKVLLPYYLDGQPTSGVHAQAGPYTVAFVSRLQHCLCQVFKNRAADMENGTEQVRRRAEPGPLASSVNHLSGEPWPWLSPADGDAALQNGCQGSRPHQCLEAHERAMKESSNPLVVLLRLHFLFCRSRTCMRHPQRQRLLSELLTSIVAFHTGPSHSNAPPTLQHLAPEDAC